jgi:hypothetical protein
MANVPLLGRDERSCKSDLPDGLSEIFLQMGLDSRLSVDWACEIGFLAHAILAASRASSEAPRRKNDQKREINGLGFRRGSTSEKDPERTSIGIAAGRMAP